MRGRAWRRLRNRCARRGPSPGHKHGGLSGAVTLRAPLCFVRSVLAVVDPGRPSPVHGLIGAACACIAVREFAREVNVVDLRSTASKCARVRARQLASPHVGMPASHVPFSTGFACRNKCRWTGCLARCGFHALKFFLACLACFCCNRLPLRGQRCSKLDVRTQAGLRLTTAMLGRPG